MGKLLNLKRALGTSTIKAVPLPDVWTGLAGESIKFRRGQVCMVAAAPNAGYYNMSREANKRTGCPEGARWCSTDCAVPSTKAA